MTDRNESYTHKNKLAIDNIFNIESRKIIFISNLYRYPVI